MPSYAEFCDDVLVSMGFTMDDRLRYRDGVLQNTIYALNKLTSQSLSNDTGPLGDLRASAELTTVGTVNVTYVEQPADIEWAHLYFNLPSEVYDLPNGAGVSWIRYHRPSLPVNCRPSIAGATFTQTTLGELSGRWGHRRLYPREDRPYFARYRNGSQDRVVLFGVSPLITKLLIGIYAVPNFLTVSYDAPVNIQPHKLADLKRIVMAMEIWCLHVPQERLKNDGRDIHPDLVLNPRPVVSLNDPAMTTQPA